MGPTLPLWVAAMVLRASSLQIGAGWQSGIYAGQAPDENGDPEARVLLLNQPVVGLRLKTPSHEWALRYHILSTYNPSGSLRVNRPVFLQMGNVSYSAKPPRLKMTAEADAAIGQVDSTVSSTLFRLSKGTSISPDVVDLATVGAALELEAKGTHRLSWLLSADGRYTVLGDLPGLALPETFFVTGEPGIKYALGPRTAWRFSIDTSYYVSSDGERRLGVGPLTGLELRLSETTKTKAEVGYVYVKQLQQGRDSTTGDNFGPEGSLELSSNLYRDGGWIIDNRAKVYSSFVFDPIVGRVEPRLGTEHAVNITDGRTFSASPTLDLSTSLAEPRPVRGTSLIEQATSLSVTLPMSYELSPAADLIFGGELYAYGPHLSEGFSLSDSLEMWAYIGLKLTLASNQQDNDWVQ